LICEEAENAQDSLAMLPLDFAATVAPLTINDPELSVTNGIHYSQYRESYFPLIQVAQATKRDLEWLRHYKKCPIVIQCRLRN
jgi:hypothetical protein